MFLRYLYYSITLSVLHVSVYKDPSWGNHTEVIQHKTSNFCTQLSWCKWVKWYLLNHGTVLNSLKYVGCLPDIGMYIPVLIVAPIVWHFSFMYILYIYIFEMFFMFVLIILMFYNIHFQHVKMRHIYATALQRNVYISTIWLFFTTSGIQKSN